MDKKAIQKGIRQQEQTMSAEDLVNRNEIKTEGPVQAKENTKLDNSRIEVDL